MSTTEIIVVLVGLAFGYWMVSNFIDGKRDQQAKKGPGPDARAGPTTWSAARSWIRAAGNPLHVGHPTGAAVVRGS